MAPQTMFAKLRNHHRRSGSTPASPQNAQRSEAPDHKTTHAYSPSLPQNSAIGSPPSSSPISSLPPVLPPIPRVASKHDTQHPCSDGALPKTVDGVMAAPPLAGGPSRTVEPPPSGPPSLPPIQRVTSQTEHKEPGRPQISPHMTPPPPRQHVERHADPPRLIQPYHSTKAPATLSRASTSFAEFSSSFMRPARSRVDPRYPSTAPSSSAQSQFPDHIRPSSNQQKFSPSSSISSLHKAASSIILAADSSPASSRSGHGSLGNSVPQRTSKSRLNLLNPVSLLMRRRTSRAFDDHSDGPVAPHRMMDVPVMDLPRNYDPRIKGKGVHDFDDSSRIKRNSSATDMLDLAGKSPASGHRQDASPRGASACRAEEACRDPSPEKGHTPIFVENFDDDTLKGPASANPVQRESLANQDFVARMSRQLDFDSIDFFAPPSTKKPSSEPSQTIPPQPASAARSSKTTDSSSVRHSSDQSTVRSSTSNETRGTSPPLSPSRDLSTQAATQATMLEPPFQPGQPLQHLSSTASRTSRFSFQLNSDQCIEQEKTLEDKHKQKHASKASKRVSIADSRFDELADEQDDVDYDDMDEIDFEEEAIPGVNASDEDEPIGLGNQRLSTFKPLIPATRASSQSVYSGGNTGHISPENASQPMYQHQNADLNCDESQVQDPDQSSSDRTMTKSTIVSDDMYFDDGIIDAPTQGGQSQYDESMFDSPTESQFSHTAIDEQLSSPPCAENGFVGSGVNAGVDTDIGPARDAPQPPAGLSISPSQQSSIDRENDRLEASALHHSSSLTAYHSALASAASQAAKSGKFDRHGSVATVSSAYSNNHEEASWFVDEDWGDDDPRHFNDADDEEDPMVAAANAEVLASDDADFYGQEFGFYGKTAGPEGEAYNGGYFGQPHLLGASLSKAKCDPNLTPITERSEYSTRNSFIGSTPWGPPSMSGRELSAMSPGLKDIAASMGLGDEDMTLGQLLRLRKVAFEGSGSGPQSAQDSSNSKDSSPTSASNSAALPFRMSPMMSAGGYGAVYGHQRHPSELELADVREAPEDEEYLETPMSGMESPISPTVTIATATAVAMPHAVGQAKRKGSAEAYAQEYAEVVSGSPQSPSRGAFMSPEPRSSSPLAINAPTIAGRGSPPILNSPPLPRSPGHKPVPIDMPPHRPTPMQGRASLPLNSSPFAASPSPRTGSSSPIPSPPIAMMHKFANRPSPDAYRKTWEPSQRSSTGMGGHQYSPTIGTSPGSRNVSTGSGTQGSTSVAYVREIDDAGREQWYLERRRKQSNGALIVVGREAVQGGSI